MQRRGAVVVAVNLRVGRDEVDLVANHDGMRVAVEVKTRCGADPVEQFTVEQAARLRRAASSLGAHRCDLVAVRVEPSGVEIRWLPGVC
jgi:Holliday junction resolvase-like predicted endonuclease